MVKSYLTETESHFDDEVEMDRWMKMTEAEQEREVKAADREFSEFLDAM